MLTLLSVCYTLSYAQTGTLTGKVLSEKKEGLIGATVKIKGTAVGGACDLDGNYTILNVPVGEQKFLVSYIGFTPKEITIEIKAGDNFRQFIISEWESTYQDEPVFC